jgi:serine/threonine protein kinase
VAELKLENSIVDERYYIERCLGCGSYAEIFVAYDQHHNDLPVIIKALNTSLQGTPDRDLKQTLIENFQNEAIALDKVRHPHIIRRLGHGSAADLTGKVFHYLVLEYMTGGDLLSLCSRRPFNLSEALFYFEQIAEALAYAHSQQVIHRDIKPKNLLLSENHKVVKIADFGVAKMTHQDNDHEITRVGTNVYAPPEHHPDSDSEVTQEKLTPSADIYSLAKTIYTAMTGRAPRQFSRKPITSLPAELASETWGYALLSVLQKATAMRVAERYASIQEFWEDFVKLNSLVADEEADEEKTLVRKRLAVTSDVKQTAAAPNFQAAATAITKHSPQPARIVVDLPTRSREPEVKSQESGVRSQESETLPAQNSINPQMSKHQFAARMLTKDKQKTDNGQSPVDPHASHNLQTHFVQQNTIAERSPEALHTRRVALNRDVERNVFDNMRAIIRSDWLRRAFIVFLIASLIGLVASVYFRFAGQHTAPPIFDFFINKDGVIGAGAINVNLRLEPEGNVLKILPKGTKVRALEERDGWVRVKVTELPPGAPSDGIDTGWVIGKYIQFD